MAKVILGVTISLLGFAEDSTDNVGPLYPGLYFLMVAIGHLKISMRGGNGHGKESC
jgi:hypothetical protein